MGSHPADDRWMALALSLGRRGMGQTWPNPAVGCVLVKDGMVVGRGWTGPSGRPHAEVEALARAGAKAEGATAYVTLEPCAHHGKTPPCAEALVAAKVARVVTAIEDPDSRVAGRGHELLRAAGVKVTTGIRAIEARRDHVGFLSRVVNGRPMVSLKLATSFDGRIATASGESQWITSAEARKHVHYLRATHDAVMVGAGTARADDPMLNVRGFGKVRQPVRIVCDSRLATPPDNKLAKTARDVPVWLCHGPEASEAAEKGWQATGAQTICCDVASDGTLDISDVLRRLGEKGLTRVFCEGGGQLAASVLAAAHADCLIGYTAGLVLGADAKSSVGGLPPQPLANHPRFKLDEVRQIGPDIIAVWEKRAD